MMAQIKLRPIVETDLPDYVRWLSDPEVTQFLSSDFEGITLQSEREWLASFQSPDNSARHFAITADGRHIGSCDIEPTPQQERIGAIGMCLGDKTAWGKGYGVTALRELLRIGFEEMGLLRIQLDVFAENRRGIRCYEKCGFRREGLQRKGFLKREEWIDVVLMAILKEEWEAMQSPPIEERGIQLREFRLTDYEQVSAVWQRAGLSPRPSDSKAEVAKKLTRDPDLFLVACDGNRVIGTVIGGWDGRRGYIYRMAVLPDCQRRGVGRSLIEELEKRFRVKGVLAINLNYDPDNPGAGAFYHSLGYEDRKGAGVMGKALEISGGSKK
jgi:RimJ/RimL family protein N-acetyltransferase